MHHAALACSSGSFGPKTYTFASPPRPVASGSGPPGRRRISKHPASSPPQPPPAAPARATTPPPALRHKCVRVAHCGPPLLAEELTDMFAAKPVTIEIVASGAGPAEISLLAAGVTEAEYVGDPGGFAFQVMQEGDGPDNADAPPPPANIMTVTNNIGGGGGGGKPSNLRAEHKVYSRSNGHLPQDAAASGPGGISLKHFSASNGHLPNNQVPSKNSNNKNFFLSRKNNHETHQQPPPPTSTGVSMTFLQSLDAKLQRLHDYTRGGGRRQRRAAPDPGPGQDAKNAEQHVVQHPRPFMTVVRQGTFLKPPPELAALLGLSSGVSSMASSAESSLCASHHHPGSSLNSSSMLYSFASRPRVLMQGGGAGRSKRQAPKQVADDTDDGQLFSNLMYDRRVVRGNTFAQQAMPAGLQPEWNPHFAYARLLSQDAQDATAAALRQAEARRRALARRKAQLQQQASRASRTGGPGRAGTPPPVPGRQHLDVQTDRYLEEIFDKPLESEVCCQTDLFVERPPTPPYVPAVVVKDAETQIETGELFDFDEEVTPVLEVLVGRTVEQALVEVLEEEETAATQRQRARLEEVRLEQLQEQARLQEQERRVRLEKDRRVAEYAAARRAQQELEERVSAAALSSDYLQQLLPDVLESLHPLCDPVQQDVGEDFMPWLLTEVQEEMQKMLTSKDIISDIVREVLETRAELKRATAGSPGLPGDHLGDHRSSPVPTVTRGVVNVFHVFDARCPSVVGEGGDADCAATLHVADGPIVS
ncbi:Radial spoke head protein 3-like protein [Frankliniella fusca]|uniref:Radial spoke head protein 3-like protein n=1 Tax=Frankliniella fusca TaxID=407009 RepID=A0AAE1H634_9NEOP|nr:Radial spoke head protein 3-like protein [Frankliniella fusca]